MTDSAFFWLLATLGIASILAVGVLIWLTWLNIQLQALQELVKRQESIIVGIEKLLAERTWPDPMSARPWTGFDEVEQFHNNWPTDQNGSYIEEVKP